MKKIILFFIKSSDSYSRVCLVLTFIFLNNLVNATTVEGTNIPAGPQPKVFAAANWDKHEAEILEYHLEMQYKDRIYSSSALIVTERCYYSKILETFVRLPEPGYNYESLRQSLYYTINTPYFPREYAISSHALRKAPFFIVRQDVSIQDWEGITFNSLLQLNRKPLLRYRNSGNSQDKEKELDEGPLITEESLFLFVRSLPIDSGYVGRIWLLPSQSLQSNGLQESQPLYADVRADQNVRRIEDQHVHYVTITREDGAKYEFWVLESGLHPIAQAKYPNGLNWKLKRLDRQRYWQW